MNKIEHAEFMKEWENDRRIMEERQDPIWSWDHLKYDRCHDGGTDPAWTEYQNKQAEKAEGEI